VPYADEVTDDAALLDQVNADLGAVDEALRRLDDGTYGVCEVCGAAIDPQTLAASPLQTVCATHQSEPVRVYPVPVAMVRDDGTGPKGDPTVSDEPDERVSDPLA
jgi:hypothetical protein